MAIILLLPLSACSPGTQHAMTQPASFDKQKVTLGKPGYVNSTPILRLTRSGLDTVDPQITYSKQKLQAALPDFTLDTVQTATDRQIKWLLTAFKNGQQQVQFEPDRAGRKIARIHMVGQETSGPNGERIGMTFAQTNGVRRTCEPGHATWSNMALCRDGTLTYIYAPQNYGATSRNLPPAPILAHFRLVRIIWTRND